MSGRDSEKIIDIHTHAFSFDTDSTGCFISKKMTDSVAFNVIRRFYGINSYDPPQVMDKKVNETISGLIDTLVKIDYIVMLAFDGVYDENGLFDRENTHFYVSNDYVKKLSVEHEKVLYGASVNPDRRDALEELERVIKDGAVLIKWLPNTHGIDPSDEKYTDFYKLLAKNSMPLLVHTGREYALNVIDQGLGDFRKLERALKTGVTVIAAHAGGVAIESLQYDYDKLIGFLKNYDNFYVDTAALFLPNKRLYLYKLASERDIHHKIVYGSDWPIPSNPVMLVRNMSVFEVLKSLAIKNGIERNLYLTNKLNFSDEIFYTGYKLIKKDGIFENV